MLCTAFLGGIIPAFAQQGGKKITGQVIDENKEPMIGVSILIVGTSTGTVTDFDGNYTLNVPQGSKELQFSYVGYETKVVPVPANSTTLNLSLIHISEPTRRTPISYAVFCLKKKNKQKSRMPSSSCTGKGRKKHCGYNA